MTITKLVDLCINYKNFFKELGIDTPEMCLPEEYIYNIKTTLALESKNYFTTTDKYKDSFFSIYGVKIKSIHNP